MKIALITKDKIFARMMHLEFSALGAQVTHFEEDVELVREKQKADLFIIDADVLLCEDFPAPEGEAVLLGYPEDLAKLPSRELTRYYVVVRPFVVKDLLDALFLREEDSAKLTLRPPKKEHPSESLALDEDSRTAYFKGEKIELTPREYSLLQLLLERKGKAVSRAEILSLVFEDAGENTNVVDVYINYLRKKIDSAFGVRLISTVRGHGYTIRS